ncbi:MAG: M14 family zinc carboxypeptidase [Bdellovibrionota bacterium]
MKKILSIFALALISFSAVADDYDKIVARLNTLDKLPNTSLFSLGKNDQGRDIMGIVVGDTSRATIKHVVVGTHHGNERASAEVPLFFAELVINTFEPSVLYYIVPVLNISGYNVSRREESGSDGDTHDSNRDYQDACTTKQDFQLKSTTLIADLIEREDVVSAVSVHGYIGTFTYPWGTEARDYATEDDAFLSAWAKKAVKINNYKVGTHGGAIYPATGAFEDWAYYKLGVWSFLLEIRSPSADLRKDAQTLVEFFKNSPTERSRKVGQHVNCMERILRSLGNSRP